MTRLKYIIFGVLASLALTAAASQYYGWPPVVAQPTQFKSAVAMDGSATVGGELTANGGARFNGAWIYLYGPGNGTAASPLIDMWSQDGSTELGYMGIPSGANNDLDITSLTSGGSVSLNTTGGGAIYLNSSGGPVVTYDTGTSYPVDASGQTERLFQVNTASATCSIPQQDGGSTLTCTHPATGTYEVDFPTSGKTWFPVCSLVNSVNGTDVVSDSPSTDKIYIYTAYNSAKVDATISVGCIAVQK